MTTTPLLLAGLAVLLAGPAPMLLARLPGLRRTPATALVLWQAVALGAVLAALGAGLAVATALTWHREVGLAGAVSAAVGIVVSALVAGRLLLSGHRVGTRLRSLRRRHREHVDLVADEPVEGVRVLDHDVPVAYCLPGMARGRVVVSAGAWGRLDDEQRRAVLAHERAHLRARHDLVVEAFTVLHRAFPRVVSSRTALDEVDLLVEALADRAAVRASTPYAVGGALAALAGGSSPPGALSAGRADALTRVGLLADPGPHRVQAGLLAVTAAAVLVAPTLLVVQPWLSRLLG